MPKFPKNPSPFMKGYTYPGISPVKHSNIDGKKHPVNTETGEPEARHQGTYAAHGMKHPDEKK